MTAQGRSDSRIGAMPIATSHGQPSAAPAIASAERPVMMAHRPRSHAGKWAFQREVLVPAAPWQHEWAESGFHCDPVLSIVSICVALSPAAGWKGAPPASLGKPTEMARAGPQQCRCDEAARRRQSRGFPAQQPRPVIAAGSRRGGQARAGDLGGKGSGAGFNPGGMLSARSANRCLAQTTRTAITFGADSVPGARQGG